MRPTTIFEKLTASILNVLIVFVCFLPIYFIFHINLFYSKIALILIFFLYQIISLIFESKRDVGMVVVGSHWKEKYGLGQHIIYSFLYTLSFSTLLFWIYFPFDLFLTNMLLLQLPTVLLKGTTFHGFLSGNMETVKND